MAVYHNPADVLKTLIRFNTTNPPGNELACVQYIDGLLQAAGIETTILARDDNRPNLIARLPGNGTAPPFLMQGHVDVVTTANQNWTHPPFDAVEVDGFIWGRGALDMKSGVAMMLCAMLKMKAEGITPNGDIILCILSDEEASARYGAKWLVENHAEQFAGVKQAIGEFGGQSTYLAGKKFYLIQMAEKLSCQLRLSIHGSGGHGALLIRGGAMTRLGKLLTKFDKQHTPIHITPVVRMMIEGIVGATKAPTSNVLRQLLRPRLTDALMATVPGLAAMRPMFRNTVSPTIVRGGDKINVIPSKIELDLDGRMLPGFTPEQFVAELRPIIGKDIDINIIGYDVPNLNPPDIGQFDMLAGILKELDPDGVPIPYMLPAISDGRFFSQLGIQTYGFTPMQLPKDFSFSATIHAADERIPVEAMNFGTQAIFMALQRYR